MRDRRHACGERAQDRRRASQRVLLERFASGEHQHDDRPGEVLAENRRGHNRDSRKEIGASLVLILSMLLLVMMAYYLISSQRANREAT